MKAVGIIAEYNPLHNGHLYHIAEAKRLSGADFVVVAMSGDFVQRGQVAVFDKWKRAQHAVFAGADVVIEIPVAFCLADASRYAHAGVELIKATGVVSDLAFGSECGDYRLLATQVRNLSQNESAIDDEIRRLRKSSGLSYPVARAEAYRRLFGEELLQEPNDILAIEYLRRIDWLNPVIVRREGSGYNQSFLLENSFQSAAAIRAAMRDELDIAGFVPEYVNKAADAYSQVSRDNLLFKLIQYKLLDSSEEEIDACPSGGDGLGARLKQAVTRAANTEELIEFAKARHTAYTRISRLLMQLLIGIKRNVHDIEPDYLRILALSTRGRRLISEMEKNECNRIPVVTNINKNISVNDNELLKLDVHAAEIYNTICSNDIYAESDYVKLPYIQKSDRK